MRARKGLLLSGSAFVASLVLAAPAFAAAYDDSACRAAPVSWANDPCAGRGWGLTNIEAHRAWPTTDGSGVTVAVVDTGVDFNHPDLAANLVSVPGANMLTNKTYECPTAGAASSMKAAGSGKGNTKGDDTKGGDGSSRNGKGNGKGGKSNGGGGTTASTTAQDDQGHGTHVAGTIAAVTNNGIGVAGVAPGARILPVKVLDSEGEGSDEDVARGICFAADHGAKIINLSLGYDPASSIIVQGLGNETDDAIEYAYSKGAALIIAAGNEGFPACDFPASASKALCVGSVDRYDVKSWFSNFGQNIGVMAPGGLGSVFCEDDEDIWSTILTSSIYDCGENGYETLSGTSMAAPHAAAVAALIAARYGSGATPELIYSKLKATSDDLGSPGFDPVYGHGRVNAYRAVTE